MRPTSGTGHRMLIYALLIAMLPMLWYHNRGDTLRAERSASERIRAEGQFILHDGDATDVLIHPAAPGWYYQGLDWIRTHLDPASPAPRYLFDPISLLLNGVNDDAVFHQFDPATRSIQRAHAYREELQRLSALLHMDTPLVYEVSREGSKLTWCLGPWTNGVYTFIVEENFRYPVPPSGYRNIRHDQDFVFRIKYELPDEWFTYSPKYVLPASLSRSVIVWPLPTQPQ